MPNTLVRISAAYWTGPSSGCVLLERDFEPAIESAAAALVARAVARDSAGGVQPDAPWEADVVAVPPNGIALLPPLKLYSANLTMHNLRLEHPLAFGKVAGYCRRGGAIVFCVDPARYAWLNFERDGLYVLGDFNGWSREPRWSLRPRHAADGGIVWELAIDIEELRQMADAAQGGVADGFAFKFRTRTGDWLTPCFEAPNRVFDNGNCNYYLHFGQTGAHAFAFDVKGGRTFVGEHVLVWEEEGFEQHVVPQPGLGFFHLRSELPLGARIEAAGGKTGAADSFSALAGGGSAHRTNGGFGDEAVAKNTEVALAGGGAFAAPREALPPAFAKTGDNGKTQQTVFRLFAPRATAVTLELRSDLSRGRLPVRVPLALGSDLLTWEARVDGNLHGVYYQYRIEGEAGVLNAFNPEVAVLDPYALATVGAAGPGIVVDHARLPKLAGQGYSFHPPRYEDALVVECHVRDLLANAPIELSPAERRGFSGLTRWLEDEDCYLRALGCNVVEFQPCQQFDSETVGEYHWGYMTTNFFSPCAWYARKRERATGEGSAIGDFAALVAQMHHHNLGVVLDVVYNHVGEPAFLAMIDKYYYFEVDAQTGEFDNASGCGNTLRADAAMSRHLIIESLRHLVETFDIDGMRFDLAELLGIGALRAIETALRKVKPSLILIAEPWSFRGHMGRQLHHSSFAFWNDGFREFAAQYVQGQGNADGLQYYAAGSIGHAALWPSQSVNYIASHDDMCWPDKITENPGHDATNPLEVDRLRTHLAAALVFGSNGIPMWPQGLDFLQSKKGINNTYLRGDLNALDYTRAGRFAATVAYVRNWIAFRKGEWGELLRLKADPTPGYLYRFTATQGSACALLFNADRALGKRRLLLAFNPNRNETATIPLPPDLDVRTWMQFADQERFYRAGNFAPQGFAVRSAQRRADAVPQGDLVPENATAAIPDAEAAAVALAQGNPFAAALPAGTATEDTREGACSSYPPQSWRYVDSGVAGAPGALVLPPLSCCLFGSEG